MAKNKSVYEVMGSVDDIVKAEEYEVHASSSPQDHFVQQKSAQIRLAEDKGYQAKKLNDAILKTAGQALQSFGQLKQQIDKPEIEMQMFNMEQQIKIADNQAKNWYAYNGETNAEETPDQRLERFGGFYGNVNELVSGYHPEVQKRWATVYQNKSWAMTDSNIVPDVKRNLNSKLVNTFDALDTLRFGEDGASEISNESWNAALDQELINIDNIYDIGLDTLNEWAGEKAIQQLDANDPRWFNYIKARQIDNTKASRDSGFTGELKESYKKYQDRVAAIQLKNKVNVVAEMIVNDDDAGNGNSIVKSSGFLDAASNKTEVTKTVIQLRNQAEIDAVTEFGAGSQEHLNELNKSVKIAIDKSYEFPSHRQSFDDLYAAITGTLTNATPQKIEQDLALYRMYKQTNTIKAAELAGKNHDTLDTFDLLSQYYDPKEALARMMRPPLDIATKDQLTTSNLYPFFSLDDNFGLSSSQNIDADESAIKFANTLMAYRVPKATALEQAIVRRDKLYPVVQSEQNTAFFREDFSFRIDIKGVHDAIRNLPVDNIYGINPNDAEGATATLVNMTIPEFIEGFRKEMQVRGDEYAMDYDYTLMKKENTNVYFLSDEAGHPVFVDGKLKEVTIEDMLDYHNTLINTKYDAAIVNMGDDDEMYLLNKRRHLDKLHFYHPNTTRPSSDYDDDELLIMRDKSKLKTQQQRSALTDPLANAMGNFYDWAVKSDLREDVGDFFGAGVTMPPEVAKLSKQHLQELSNFAKWNTGVLSYDEIQKQLTNKIDSMYKGMLRADGTYKSMQGYLGQIVNEVTGETMTEVTAQFEDVNNGKEIPLLVPTLTADEINQLQNMEIEGNLKNIPQSIKDKAKSHAKKRISQGKSPFYQDGEEEAESQDQAVTVNPHEDFNLLIGQNAEADHGSEPKRTNDAAEKNLPIDQRSYDIGYGHKIKKSEWTSGMIHGIPFVDSAGNYLKLTEEQKQTILHTDMQAESTLARKVWDKKLEAQGSSWDELDIGYQQSLNSLAFNIGGSKAGKQYSAVLTAAINKDVKEFAKQLRRQDSGKHTAGMDNRVLKELFYANLIKSASEVSDVLPLANARQAGVPL